MISANGSTGVKSGEHGVQAGGNTEQYPVLDAPVFTQLPPPDVLEPSLHAAILRSLEASPSDLSTYAASARYWERLLQDGHRLPVLLRKVAEVRWVLGSRVTALHLYEELYALHPDENLGCWLRVSRPSVWHQYEEMLHAYKDDKAGRFTPAQRWRPTSVHDNEFPTSLSDPSKIRMMREGWQEVTEARYNDMICINSVALENVVRFDDTVAWSITTVGFDRISEVPCPDGEHIIGGMVRNLDDAVSILQDTRAALQEVSIFCRLYRSQQKLDLQFLCHLHTTLMRTSQVLHVAPPGGQQSISYVNIGVTRGSSRHLVTADMADGGAIQFCPYDEVDAELEAFCQRANILIHRSDIDPFAAAAWIHHVFITIHPFEDGNGRMARLLSSIPLLLQGLPPINVPYASTWTREYILALNEVRARRNGHFERLQSILLLTTLAAVREAYFISQFRSTGTCTLNT